jgi:UDP-N-acetylglucosamine 2-epimerase (non-hydrolysing)
MPRIVNICGARPNFMKIAPLMRAYAAHPAVEALLVHTGQHYDERMSGLFFRDLDIAPPHINLEVGSASHARQTADIMTRIEPVLMQHKPDWLVVVGDVNSTIACALVAAKLDIKVAHVEAGLRSFDRTMPEEVNRLLTDAISELLLVSEPSGLQNLRREGHPPERIHFVGNVMIDTLRACSERAQQSGILERFGLTAGRYNLVTLHRPSNVDDPEALQRIAGVLEELANDLPTLFPVHPRTRERFRRMGLSESLERCRGLHLIDPLGYLDFLKLLTHAAVVLTDSGGIQEETTILGVWCLTLRDNTERPITLTHGTNTLVGSEPARILAGYQRCRTSVPGPQLVPELWDGQAAPRIAAILARS